MRIFFHEDYPAKPPKVRFTCEMYHPNGTPISPCALCDTDPPATAVYTDGVLCLDIIQDQWKPIYTVASILTSIQVIRREPERPPVSDWRSSPLVALRPSQSMLADPNPASPANPEAAQMWENDRKEYNKRVRRCAQKSVDC